MGRSCPENEGKGDGSMTLEGSGQTVHEPTVWKNSNGFLTIDWHGKEIEPGDKVLMSAELFAECIRAMNQLAGR